jgi:hypothetical protein
MAGTLDIEDRGGMFGILEHVGCRLVNGRGPGAGSGVWPLAGMQGQCIQFERFDFGHTCFLY